jgi:hypothetical protein
MKTIQFIYVLVIIFVSLNMGCTKQDSVTPYDPNNPQQPSGCTSADSSVYQASINGYDYTIGSPYYGQVVANFKFIQSESTCPSMTSSTDLIIANLTPNTISFAYNIVFHLNYVSWSYQNAVAIPPFSSIDVGNINSNPTRVDLGSFVIQGSNITYY